MGRQAFIMGKISTAFLNAPVDMAIQAGIILAMILIAKWKFKL